MPYKTITQQYTVNEYVIKGIPPNSTLTLAVRFGIVIYAR